MLFDLLTLLPGTTVVEEVGYVFGGREGGGQVIDVEVRRGVSKSNYAVTGLYRRNVRQFFKPDN